MKRAYWTKPDVFEAEVEVRTLGDCKVTIDPNMFHPDEGGQPADKGSIGPATICRIEITEGQIVHTLDRPLADGTYTARLDAEHRLYTAAHHTAQHIISGIAESRFGLHTTGVHIGLERCTVDFDRKTDWQTLRAIEREAMQVVALNVPVETVFDDTDVRIRSDSKQITPEVVRVVRIGDYDSSACCGAHVAATGRIGLIRIFETESKKQGTRVYFLAGSRALEMSQSETAILAELRKTAGCSTVELPESLRKTLDRSKSLAKEIEKLWSAQLPALAAASQVVQAGAAKVGICVAELPANLTGKLAAMIAEQTGGAGIVVNGLHIAISSKNAHAGELLRKIQGTLGGKGGGSPKAANGILNHPPTPDQIAKILTTSP